MREPRRGGVMREWLRYVTSHKYVLLWPLVVLVLTFCVLAWFITRAPAAPFIYR